MNELFKEEIEEAEEMLEKKGFYVANMRDCYNDEFEVYNKNAEVVIDHLSVAQLTQLADMVTQISWRVFGN